LPPHVSTQSLHDALPIFEYGAFRISRVVQSAAAHDQRERNDTNNDRQSTSCARMRHRSPDSGLNPRSTNSASTRGSRPRNERYKDRKSTRLNSSHVSISY